MDFTGIFQGLSMNYATGKQTASFELNEDAREAFQDLKGCEKLTIQIKKYRKKRSLDANAYYWVLVSKLGKVLDMANPEVHNIALIRYGQPWIIDGKSVFTTIPDTEDAENQVRYAVNYHLQPTYISLYASTPEGLRMRDIKLADGGTLPKSGTGKLELVYGNNVLANFSERGNNSSGYWETGELPDIDLMKDSMFMILDQDAYYNRQSSGGLQGDAGTDGNGTSNVPQSAKKHIVTASGVVAGGVDDYNMNSYYVFCDLDTLKQIMKKEFKGRVIPGQPSTKSGKAYKEFYYSSAQVKVDDMSNVNDAAKQIREMGYNVETNVEYMDSMKKQMAVIQAVLGGIGAISLIVAAIGIANTMMMSIYERTKEIGVIKVLGCSLKNIKQMFLIEAAFIGLLGGIVGNMVSFAMSGAINMVIAQSSALGVEGNISYIPVWLVLISLGFAMLVGMVAGYFPALRAMSLSPLAAIRSE